MQHFDLIANTVQSLQHAPVGAGLFDWINNKSQAAQNAIQGLLVLVGLIVGLVIAWRGKTVGSVILAVVVGGLIAALPALIQFFGGLSKGETQGMVHGVQYASAALRTHLL